MHAQSYKWCGTQVEQQSIGMTRMSSLTTQVTLEDVLRISSDLGFTMLQQQSSVPSPYTSDKHSMMSTAYQCEFWTMQKKLR